jgi:hypothetical protein
MWRPGVATLLVRTTGLMVLVPSNVPPVSLLTWAGKNAIARAEVGGNDNNHGPRGIRVDLLNMIGIA